MINRHPIGVIKIGGSLLDIPDLITRLTTLIEARASEQVLLVVGGGSAADIVRRFDQTYRVSPSQGHWLAVRAMQLNTCLVATILPRCRIITNAEEAQGAWHNQDTAMVDPLRWLEQEHARGVTTPHRWSFTSDSIAAHVARQTGAARLTLLKSTVPDQPCDVGRAVTEGLVDEDFAQASRGIDRIDLINLRVDPPQCCVLGSTG